MGMVRECGRTNEGCCQFEAPPHKQGDAFAQAQVLKLPPALGHSICKLIVALLHEVLHPKHINVGSADAVA